MTVPGHNAAARRERLLRRTRTITLGIAGGAAVASLSLGTALAHVIPGHGRPAARAATAAHATPRHEPAGPAASGPATSGHAAPSGTAPAASPPPARVPHHRHRLAPPASPPASTPAAPHASSGGS
jgi:hypothetical protein